MAKAIPSYFDIKYKIYKKYTKLQYSFPACPNAHFNTLSFKCSDHNVSINQSKLRGEVNNFSWTLSHKRAPFKALTKSVPCSTRQ